MGGGGDGDADNETGTSKSNVGPVAAVFGSDGSGGGGDEGGEGMMQTSSFAFMHITPESEISSWQQRPPQPRP